MIKICKICNKKFKANSNRQTRCVDCMKITCKHCGKEFIPKNHNFTQVYCSRKCKGLNQKHIIINLIKNRGTKPRTYKKRNKHGSIEDREWREKIFKRDNYTCQMCGKKGGRLQAHHIKPYKKYPQLKHNLDNGMTLCISCHKKTDSYGWANYWKNY